MNTRSDIAAAALLLLLRRPANVRDRSGSWRSATVSRIRLWRSCRQTSATEAAMQFKCLNMDFMPFMDLNGVVRPGHEAFNEY